MVRFTDAGRPSTMKLYLVDVFYMKSCAFRGAQTRPSISHSFFVEDDEQPSAVYSLLPCERPSCVCHSSMLSDETTAVGASLVPVRFSDAGHSHRFVNGYEVILNCPAVRIELDSCACLSSVQSDVDMCHTECNLCSHMCLQRIRLCWIDCSGPRRSRAW